MATSSPPRAPEPHDPVGIFPARPRMQSSSPGDLPGAGPGRLRGQERCRSCGNTGPNLPPAASCALPAAGTQLAPRPVPAGPSRVAQLGTGGSSRPLGQGGDRVTQKRLETPQNLGLDRWKPPPGGWEVARDGDRQHSKCSDGDTGTLDIPTGGSGRSMGSCSPQQGPARGVCSLLDPATAFVCHLLSQPVPAAQVARGGSGFAGARHRAGTHGCPRPRGHRGHRGHRHGDPPRIIRASSCPSVPQVSATPCSPPPA